MKLFTIILNWNQPKLTRDCIASVKQATAKGVDLRIVVVDNGSTDNSIDILENIEGIELVRSHKNLGFAGGNNLGMDYALRMGADWVFILNNDTELAKHIFKNFLKVSKKTKIGAISPKIYFAQGFEFHKERYRKDDKGRVIWSAGGTIDWNNVMGKNIGVDEVDTGQFDGSREIDFATGAAVFYNANALRQVGLFNENYFMYLEDVELAVSLRQKGWKIMYQPDLVVFHKVAQSSAVGSNLNDYFITRNRLLFGLKYASPRTKFALIRESIRFLLTGRGMQKKGVTDFYTMKLGKGSWT